jgi:hypothetical protein
LDDSLGEVLQGEEYNLLTFYLYDYKLRRISKEDWVEFCDGPLIVEKSDYGNASSFLNSYRKFDLDAYFVFFKN